MGYGKLSEKKGSENNHLNMLTIINVNTVFYTADQIAPQATYIAPAS